MTFDGRDAKLTKNLSYLMEVKGFVITEISKVQYRIFGAGVGEFMDVYPTNQRYENIITGERGHYKTIQAFLNLQLDRTSQFIAKSNGGQADVR